MSNARNWRQQQQQQQQQLVNEFLYRARKDGKAAQKQWDEMGHDITT
jgi:hypothetical protein